jgi:hypothetical protein
MAVPISAPMPTVNRWSASLVGQRTSRLTGSSASTSAPRPQKAESPPGA